MRKVSAFTIMETVIVLLLTAIILAITYGVLQIVQNRYMDYTQKNSDIVKIDQLHSLLNRDFALSKRIAWDYDNLICIQDSLEIYYLFESTMIIREQASIQDTFAFEHNKPEIFFQKKPCLDKARILDEFSFRIAYEEEIYPFYFRKEYDLMTLMEINE